MTILHARAMKREPLANLLAGILFCLSVLIVSSAAVSAQVPALAPRLKVSPNHRWLQYSDGRPFFYLGDTSWHLFPNVTRERADLYLANRAAKGFTVIQACVLNNLDEPNAYGEKPLVDHKPERPNENYFDDYVLDAGCPIFATILGRTKDE
ncbi:MAG TPA: DUF4038 domain-containing protein [Terriglobales bacterium]|nr:DUF4038 domain-containing protein [Terriglobales bacterium]